MLQVREKKNVYEAALKVIEETRQVIEQLTVLCVSYNDPKLVHSLILYEVIHALCFFFFFFSHFHLVSLYPMAPSLPHSIK